MLKKTVFIKNAAILTVSSLLLRFAGIVFKVWLASAIGAEGIGLYQLIFSVYMLASTFATSGICTAATRLIADELALGCENGVRRILRRCIQVTLLIAAATILLLLAFGDTVATKIIGDFRAAKAIKILSFSLPFMGVSSCFKGYFIARRKATPAASSQILEQAVRILLIMLLVKKFAWHGLEFSCVAVIIGDTVAEVSSAVVLYLVYIRDSRRLSCLSGRDRPPYKILSAIKHIALPITSGRYLNTALRTTENILVPKGLSKYRYGGENALSQFGMIKGMALPLLFFPSTLLNSLSTLLIPEMSEAKARGHGTLVKMATERILRVTALVSYPVMAVFFFAGREIGTLIYKNGDVGMLLCALSPIVPLMYLDSVSDGILKGLDQQRFTFRTAVTDSSLRILLVILLLPHLGLDGFIGIMYLSNLLTCFLNVGRLLYISGADLDLLRSVLIPFCTSLSVTLGVRALLLSFPVLPLAVYICVLSLMSAGTYAVLLFALHCITADDIRDIIR